MNEKDLSSNNREKTRPKQKKKVQQGFFVISVKQGVGCYRHLKVPKNYKLNDLVDAILWAFDFENDHAHAFFMNNQAWTDNDCYYMEEVDEEEEYRHTCDYDLSVLHLGQKFKFVFDFGDDWEFDCAVLREDSEGANDAAELVRSKGESPHQYKYCDDDDAVNNMDDDTNGDADGGGFPNNSK